MAKRKQGVDTWGLDREYTARGYKVEARPSLEEQLSAVQARVELIKNGSDDALLEELERLSRSREDKLNALTAKDSGAPKGKAPPNNNRKSGECQMKAVSDEFDQLRADAQKRLLKECMDEEERLKDEIASNKGAGIQMREKRKTRARLDAEATVPNSQANILNKLMELEGRVALIREDLETDLDCLRLKEGKSAKFVPQQSAPPPLPRAVGKAPVAKPPVVERPLPSKAPLPQRGTKPPTRGLKRENSDASNSSAQPPARQASAPPEKKGNGRMPGEHKVYSAKGIMYCSGLRILKGEEVKVTMPDGEEVVGRLSSVNSLEMRLMIHGQESLYKVMLAHLRTGKATVIKTDAPAASA